MVRNEDNFGGKTLYFIDLFSGFSITQDKDGHLSPYDEFENTHLTSMPLIRTK